MLNVVEVFRLQKLQRTKMASTARAFAHSDAEKPKRRLAAIQNA
jgi:hypothetical protein